MTLQGSGTIKFSEIATEFSDSSPTSLSEFYGLGSPALPSSGTISMSDFYGVSAAVFTVDLPASTQASTNVEELPSDSFSGWKFKVNGVVQKCNSTSLIFANDHDWGTPNTTGAGSDYDIKFTKNSGTTPTGVTLGTWLSLGTDRQVYLQQSGTGVDSCSLNVVIRDANTLTELDSQTYTISASVISGG